MDVLRRFAAPAVLGLVTATATACGAEGPDLSIHVLSPAAGELVVPPFEVVLDASVPLGPVGEAYHAHIWFGPDEAAYVVCEAAHVQVNNAPDGVQTMHVSLRNGDHSPTGVETSVELTIVG